MSINKNLLKMSKKTNFETYISELNDSFFCLSPNGNGVDCHKTWESIYLKTIPVITESINIKFYKDFPIYIIESWENFNINELTIELYNDIIQNFDFNKININFFLDDGDGVVSKSCDSFFCFLCLYL